MNWFLRIIKVLFFGYTYCPKCKRIFKKHEVLWTFEKGIEYYNGICNCKFYLKDK